VNQVMGKSGRKDDKRKPIFLLVTILLLGVGVLIAAREPVVMALNDALATATPLDSIQITASAIVGQATNLALTRAAATLRSDLDPLDLTATWIIGQATIAAGSLVTKFLSPTPAPTLSAQEEEALVARWTNELENAAGFSHPVFSYIAYGLLEPVESAGRFRDYFIHPLTVRKTYAGHEYAAILVREPDYPFVQFWIFRLTDDAPLLIANTSVSLGVTSTEIDANSYKFADLNGNGLPDLSLFSWSGGNCPSMGFQLLEIQPDAEIVNVAASIPFSTWGILTSHTDLYDSVINFEPVDLNQDRIMEIKVTGKFFDYVGQPNAGCNFLPLVRYYSWNGIAYEDITSTLDETYYPGIDAYFKSIEQPTCLAPDLAMDQMLVDYLALGRLKEGWARLEPQLHWELCSPETLVRQGTLMGELLVWIGTYLEKE
jgi:hypothetical protein